MNLITKPNKWYDNLPEPNRSFMFFCGIMIILIFFALIKMNLLGLFLIGLIGLYRVGYFMISENKDGGEEMGLKDAMNKVVNKEPEMQKEVEEPIKTKQLKKKKTTEKKEEVPAEIPPIEVPETPQITEEYLNETFVRAEDAAQEIMGLKERLNSVEERMEQIVTWINSVAKQPPN